MAKKKVESEQRPPLCVDIREAAPNKMWSDEERSWIRFLVYSEPVRCAECHKKKKVMWTMLCQFKACTFPEKAFVMVPPAHSHMPLTPVCDEHPLAIAWPEEETAAAQTTGEQSS